MVHYEGGVEVELRSSFDGVGDRAQKAEGLSQRKPLGFVQAIYKKRYNRLLLDGRQLSSYLLLIHERQ